MRLHHCLAYLLCAALLSSSALACDNVTIHIQHGGPTGYLIRYRITIGAFQTTGVLAEGASTPVQCLNSGQQVSVDVYEVNGTPVSYPASGSPQTYTSGGPTTLNFTISGSAPPPSNWKYDAKTCNNTALPQYYDIIINGVVVSTEGPINPGECFQFHFEDTNKKSIQFVRRTVDPDGNRTVTDYSRLIGSDDPGWYNTGGGPGLQTGTDGVTHVPNADVSNPKIPWDDSKTSPATDDAVRKGFESLYGLQSQSAQQGANENRAQTEKLTAVENAVNSGFANINGNLVAVQTAVNAVNSGVAGLGAKIDSVGAAVTAQGVKLDGINTKLGSLDSSLTAINSSVSTIHNDQTMIIAKLGNIDSDLQGVAKDATLTATKSTISTEATATRDKLDSVKIAVDQVKTSIGNEDQNNTAGHAATKLSVDQTKSVLDSIYQATQDGRTENNVANSAIQGKLDTANQNLSDIKNNTANLASGINGLGNKIDNVSNRVVENTTNTGGLLNKIIKLLDHSDHNPDHDGMLAQGITAGHVQGDQLENIGNAVHAPSVQVSALNPWMVSLGTRPSGGAWEVDINPLSYSGVAEFASWFKQAVIWISTLVYVMACYNVVHETILMAPSARQAQSASVVPAASTAFALGAAGFITIALAALPALFVSFIASQGISFMGTSPFAGGNSAIQMGVSLAGAFLPLETILSHLVLYFAFKIKAGSVWWIVTTGVRFVVG